MKISNSVGPFMKMCAVVSRSIIEVDLLEYYDIVINVKKCLVKKHNGIWKNADSKIDPALQSSKYYSSTTWKRRCCAIYHEQLFALRFPQDSAVPYLIVSMVCCILRQMCWIGDRTLQGGIYKEGMSAVGTKQCCLTGTFKFSGTIIKYLHIDIVIMPWSEIFWYCLVFTEHQEAATVERVLFSNWIARFGALLKITSNIRAGCLNPVYSSI